jgi:tetratricopeptide (TPR) repeat protein
MYEYNRRRKIGPFTILFLFLFSASAVGLLVVSYLDRGRFWDMLPYFSIPIIVLSLIFAIYNLVRRCNAGFVFIIIFIAFTIGLVLSSVFGPFALYREADARIEEKDYPGAISRLDSILASYPSSRYAEEALETISYAYYDNNQFNEALRSFNAAIDKGVIDRQQLEVMDILQDIHYRIALEHKEDGKHLEAAGSYMDSIEILKQIKSGFPDSNEAFIALYKIPRYLFDASESFDRHGDILSRIRLLEEIIADYQESDYYQSAREAAYDAYLDMALASGSGSDHKDALEWFLRFLKADPEPEIDRVAEYKTGMIFEATPAQAVRDSGDAAFMKSDFTTAVFMYERLIEHNPDMADLVLENLVKSKIILAREKPYSGLFDQVSGKYVNTPGSGMLVIINDTAEKLTAYIEGPESHMAPVPAGDTAETALVPGEYTILLESEDSGHGPFLDSNIVFEEFRKYTVSLEALDEESS